MADGRIKKGVAIGERKPDFEFIPSVGVRATTRKDFMDYDAALAHAAALGAAGFRAGVAQKGDEAIWTVSSSFEGDPNDPDGDVQDTHELRVNVDKPDIQTSTLLQAKFAATYGATIAMDASAMIAEITEEVETYRSAELKRAEYARIVGDMTSTTFAADAGVLALRLFHRLLSNDSSFVNFQYVYVHTFNVGVQRELVPDRFGELQIFTPAGVVQEEGTPSLLGLVGVGGEWLKLPVETTTMYGGRVLHKYEYWWESVWDDLTYNYAGL